MTEIGIFWLGLIVGGAGLELLRQWHAGVFAARCRVCRTQHRAD